MPLRNTVETFADDLRDPAFALEYLRLGWEDDWSTFLVSLRDIIQVNGGLSKIANATSLSRETLDAALSSTSPPRIAILRILLRELGYDFGSVHRFAVSAENPESARVKAKAL